MATLVASDQPRERLEPAVSYCAFGPRLPPAVNHRIFHGASR